MFDCSIGYPEDAFLANPTTLDMEHFNIEQGKDACWKYVKQNTNLEVGFVFDSITGECQVVSNFNGIQPWKNRFSESQRSAMICCNKIFVFSSTGPPFSRGSKMLLLFKIVVSKTRMSNNFS